MNDPQSNNELNSNEQGFLETSIARKILIILILFSAFCFSLETAPKLADSTKAWLQKANLIITVLFTIEYLIRVVQAKNSLKFIFSFFGIIDLLAILPFYLSLGLLDLRSLRLLRLLKLIRVIKIISYNQAINRFAKAISSVKEELLIFFFSTLLMFYLAAVGIYHFEHEAQPEIFNSIFNCLWWSVATLTTVGYGDIYPITIGGRVFTLIILILGLGFVAIPSGIIASALSDIRKDNSDV